MTITKTIPAIDISPYLDSASSEEAKQKIIHQVKNACSTYGFLQVKGHGVPTNTQRRMLQCCKVLFDLPDEQKQALSLKNNAARRGYEQIGEQTLDSKALPDCKEGFYIGREIPPSDSSFLRGPNQWPPLPAESFRTPVTAYYKEMLRLSNNLIEMLVIALGHPASVLEHFTREPVMNLKLLHYPPHTSTDPLQFGAGAHTDFGAMTILLQQPGVEGLQVYDAVEDEWMPVPAAEDVFVVNIGDLIQKWTEGEYSSTVHRVVNKAGGDRYSVPCFFHGDVGATNPFDPGASTETVEEHIRRKFDASYGLEKN